MVTFALIALLAGAGAYAAAERGGRSAELWLVVTAGMVLTACFAISDILTTPAGIGSAWATALFLAPPLAGLVVGMLVIGWLWLSPRKPSLSAPIHMLHRGDGYEMTEVTLRFEVGAFFVRRGDEEQRIETKSVGGVEIDGEYLIVHVLGQEDALRLRPVGEAYVERQRAAALLVALATRLRGS